MTAAKRAALLLLVAAVMCAEAEPEAGPENCDGLNVTLPIKDLDAIFGDWVLVWSISDSQVGRELLKNLTSSHVEMKLQSDKKTVEYNERNNLMSYCVSYYVNVTMSSEDDSQEHYTLMVEDTIQEVNGIRTPLNDTGNASFFKSSSDSMTMLYNSKTFGRYLLFYKREGHHRDVDQMKAAHPDHEKLAGCLKFPVEDVFVYDGAADFCHKKSAPEEKPEEPEGN